MPIYEYQCSGCGAVSEEWTRSFDAPEEIVCPQCQAPARRQVSHTAFVLKGSGWFASEYKPRPKETSETGPETPASEKTAQTNGPENAGPKPVEAAGQSNVAPAAAPAPVSGPVSGPSPASGPSGSAAV